MTIQKLSKCCLSQINVSGILGPWCDSCGLSCDNIDASSTHLGDCVCKEICLPKVLALKDKAMQIVPPAKTLLTNEEVQEGFEKEFVRIAGPAGEPRNWVRESDADAILAFILAQRTADLKWVEEVVIGRNKEFPVIGDELLKLRIFTENNLRDSQRALLSGIK